MQDARPGTVLGRFDSTRFTDAGVTSTFLRRGDRYVVNTEGADGALHDFEVRYTFGVSPLQQYLVDFPGGRIQPLPLAWDTRPAAEGGQRWFSLHPGPRLPPTDDFHWTGRLLNWNYMCADCHSTAVRKGYVAAADSFATRWEEINVACEACHGPGARHATRARYPRWLRGILWRDDGLPAQLTERQGVRWSTDTTTGIPSRSVMRHTDREIETCAQCHARRTHIADGYTAGQPLLDFYVPLPLVAGLYYADGQQEDEVYTYASFLQSKMYRAGVTCADCHDPHTQKLRRPGNQMCMQCHGTATYNTPAHRSHVPNGQGTPCVSCHMPTTTYMQIDPRHDHSIRIPRPDLSASLGVPNVCAGCHANRDAQWAALQLRTWYQKTPTGFQRFATSFAADDRDVAGAADSLAAVASDATEPAIARASALARLGRHPGAIALHAAESSSRDANPLVRVAALSILEVSPPAQRIGIAVPLLADERRAVRVEAAWLLAPVSASLETAAQRSAFASAAAEFIASRQYNADRPDDRLALGSFYVSLGRLDSAAVEYRAAIHLAPRLVRAYLALAQVLRSQRLEPEAHRALCDGLIAVPNDPDLRRALGNSPSTCS